MVGGSTQKTQVAAIYQPTWKAVSIRESGTVGLRHAGSQPQRQRTLVFSDSPVPREDLPSAQAMRVDATGPTPSSRVALCHSNSELRALQRESGKEKDMGRAWRIAELAGRPELPGSASATPLEGLHPDEFLPEESSDEGRREGSLSITPQHLDPAAPEADMPWTAWVTKQRLFFNSARLTWASCHLQAAKASLIQ